MGPQLPSLGPRPFPHIKFLRMRGKGLGPRLPTTLPSYDLSYSLRSEGAFNYNTYGSIH